MLDFLMWFFVGAGGVIFVFVIIMLVLALIFRYLDRRAGRM